MERYRAVAKGPAVHQIAAAVLLLRPAEHARKVRVCVYACVCACVCMCVRMCVCVFVRPVIMSYLVALCVSRSGTSVPTVFSSYNSNVSVRLSLSVSLLLPGE